MGVLSRVWDLLRPRQASAGSRRTRASDLRANAGAPYAGRTGAAPTTGAAGTASVVEADLPPARGLRLGYEPRPDELPDPGEIVWAWVPYAEDASRGKDRPLLVLARANGDRSWAMKLTSKPHDGERDHLPLGAGDWDPQGRPSWLDVDQIYLVSSHGVRRGAGALGRPAYDRVARALSQRYGWPVSR